MPAPAAKAEGALRTIGEVVRETGVPAHLLRTWEARFPQLRPLTRAGQRRYYRADDVALVRRIDRLLNQEGLTLRGVRQVLETPDRDAALRAIREGLAAAIADDGDHRDGPAPSNRR